MSSLYLLAHSGRDNVHTQIHPLFSFQQLTLSCCVCTHFSQIPTSSLKPEQLKKHTPEGGEPPMYIDDDFENIRDYYSIGALLLMPFS